MGVQLFRSSILSGVFLLILSGLRVTAPAAADGPSFECGSASGSIEEMICNDDELSALDRKLAGVYAAASKNAADEHPPVLKAEQRGWIRGRNECWKSDAPRSCTEKAYRLRITELQARYRLVPAKGPIWYACGGNPENELVVTFFRTDPPTLIAERGDQVSLMYLEPSGSGTRYRGRNESFWEHQGEATVVWGYGGAPVRCSRRPSALQTSSDAAVPASPMPLTDLPVVDMQTVPPSDYEAASAFAVRGGAPLDIALKIAGAFEGSAQHIIQENEGVEAPTASRITVIRDGLVDDSIRGVRWDIQLKKAGTDLWRIDQVTRSWRCWRGGQIDRFAAAACP